jgi:hypothetical protein
VNYRAILYQTAARLTENPHPCPQRRQHLSRRRGLSSRTGDILCHWQTTHLEKLAQESHSRARVSIGYLKLEFMGNPQGNTSCGTRVINQTGVLDEVAHNNGSDANARVGKAAGAFHRLAYSRLDRSPVTSTRGPKATAVAREASTARVITLMIE